MDSTESIAFIRHLTAAYPQVHLTPALLDLWTQDLAFVEVDDLHEAYRRHVRTHQPTHPPTLEGLLTGAEQVRQARRAQAVAAARATMADHTLASVLHAASSRVSARDRAWAREHVAMFLAGVSTPGRAADAIAWCERKAQEYPEDAQDWLREAQTYRLELEQGQRERV